MEDNGEEIWIYERDGIDHGCKRGEKKYALFSELDRYGAGFKNI